MDLIRQIYTAMLGCITVTDIQSQVIQQTVSQSLTPLPSDSETAGSSGQALNEAWMTALQAELTETIQAVADLANARLAKLVTNRADVHAQLPLRDFVEIFGYTWQFVLKCETLGRKMIVGLRGVILAQVRSSSDVPHDSAEPACTVENLPSDIPSTPTVSFCQSSGNGTMVTQRRPGVRTKRSLAFSRQCHARPTSARFQE
jgi:hypothetical protein